MYMSKIRIMKQIPLTAARKTVLYLLLAALPLALPAQTTFSARSGSKMRIEGTSNVHDWQVESPFISGLLVVGPDFPVEPGKKAKPGKMDAKADVSIAVRSLKSLEKDGKPYSDSMDEIMYEKLQVTAHPAILYHLLELTLKEAPKSKDLPYVYDSKGELEVAGVTNTISMPIDITPLEGQKLKVTGSVTLKMTDFKIDPPAPKLALGLIKTGDEVKLFFEWILAPKKKT